MNTAGGRLRVFALAVIVLTGFCYRMNGGADMDKNSPPAVRRSYGAGRWFPGSKSQLEAMVSGFMREAKPPPVEGRIVAAIAPHAGYIYSGSVAGYTFRAIKDNAAARGAPDAVVILGFSHRGAFRGVALLDGSAIETPLGRAELAAYSPAIAMNSAPHAGEHSAENEIPFVQAALPGTKIVVGILGEHSTETLDTLVKALMKVSEKRRLLVVASTDLLHDPDYDRVSRTDRKTLETIVAMDPAKLASSWSYQEQVCCGIGPVLTALRYAAAKGCGKGTLLHYRNSGDDYPDSRGQWVVGYGSVVFAVPRPDGRESGKHSR
jgi:AmmeMemoRadiSam system protein B